MIDYDEAVAKGMAITVPITAEQAAGGFARLYVVGLRAEDAAAGADRLETLLDNHHYGPTGLELLAPGTATNAAEGAAPGFSSRDDPDAAYDVERAAPLLDPAAVPAEPAAAPDGLRLARALGVDAATLAHVAGAGGLYGRARREGGRRGAVPATVGGWLEGHAAGLVGTDSRDRLAALASPMSAARGGAGSAHRRAALRRAAHRPTRLRARAGRALGRGASVVDRPSSGASTGCWRRRCGSARGLGRAGRRREDRHRPRRRRSAGPLPRAAGAGAGVDQSSYRFAVNVAGPPGIGLDRR
ncbi:MAG: hypothetical protein R2736_13440 [Solirubrobacterales bacterium]